MFGPPHIRNYLHFLSPTRGGNYLVVKPKWTKIIEKHGGPDMMAGRPTARAALDFQLAARNRGLKAKLITTTSIHRQRKTPHQWGHVNQLLSDLSGTGIARHESRNFTTSSIVNAARAIPKRTNTNPQGQTFSKATPSSSSQSNSPVSRQIKANPTAFNSSGSPSTPSSASPSPLSPAPSTHDEEEQFFILKHFTKPEPMFVRGIKTRPKNNLSMITQRLVEFLLLRPKHNATITPDNIPRLGQENNNFFLSLLRPIPQQASSWSKVFKAANFHDQWMIVSFLVGSICLFVIAREKLTGPSSRANRRVRAQRQDRTQHHVQNGDKEGLDVTDQRFRDNSNLKTNNATLSSEPGLEEVLVQRAKSS